MPGSSAGSGETADGGRDGKNGVAARAAEGVEAATADVPLFRQILPLAHAGFLEAYDDIRHELHDAV